MIDPSCSDCAKLTGGCALHAAISLGRESQSPHSCPVCGGKGLVMPGFYSPWGAFGTNVVQDTCRSCGGSGVLWR